MKKYIYTLIILFIGLLEVQGQVRFEHLYDVLLPNNAIRDVRQTSDGGYIVAGVTQANCQTLIKLNAQGDTLWTKRYRAARPAISHSVRQTPDGGYILVGNEYGYSQPVDSGCIRVIKTNSIGDTLWTKSFGMFTPNIGLAPAKVEVYSNGDFLISGNISYANTTTDAVLIRMKSNGDTLWTKRYIDVGRITDFAIDNTNEHYFTTENGFNKSSYIKMDSVGNVIWKKHNNTKNYINVFKLGADIIVVSENVNNVMVIFRFNSLGNPVWLRAGEFTLGHAQEASDSGVIITGTYIDTGHVSSSILLRVNSNGDTAWTAGIAASSPYAKAQYVGETGDGGFIIAGQEGDGIYSRPFLVKADSLRNANCNDNDMRFVWSPHGMFIDSGSVIVESGISIFNTSLDVESGMIVDAHCSPTSIDDYLLPRKISIFPNPSTGRFYLLEVYDKGILDVYKSDGAQLLHQAIIPGTNNEIDLSDQPTGLYIMRMIVGNKISYSKLLVN